MLRQLLVIFSVLCMQYIDDTLIT